MYILDSDADSTSVSIQLFDRTAYALYYAHPHTLRLFAKANTVLLPRKALAMLNNKVMYVVSWLFRRCRLDAQLAWPAHLTLLIIRRHLSDFVSTRVPLEGNMCSVVKLEPRHAYCICMRTTRAHLSSPASDVHSFETPPFALTQRMLDMYCSAFAAFVRMMDESAANRGKLWSIVASATSVEYAVDELVVEMMCSFLCLYAKKLNCNRAGVSIPVKRYGCIAKQAVIETKKVLPPDEQHIAGLLGQLSMQQILLDAL